MTDKQKALELADMLYPSEVFYINKEFRQQIAAELRYLYSANSILLNVLHQVRIDMVAQDVLPEWLDTIDEALNKTKEQA